MLHEPTTLASATALLATAMLRRHPGATILHDLICSRAVPEVIVEHGSGSDTRMRSAVATVLLEPLLEDHYDRYFRRLATQVREGNRNLTDTLRRCWMFGGAKTHSREVDRLIRNRPRSLS